MISHPVSHPSLATQSPKPYLGNSFFICTKPNPPSDTFSWFIFIPKSITSVLQQLQRFTKAQEVPLNYIRNQEVQSGLVKQPLAVCWLFRSGAHIWKANHFFLPIQSLRFHFASLEVRSTASFKAVTSKRSLFEEFKEFVLRCFIDLLKNDNFAGVKE